MADNKVKLNIRDGILIILWLLVSVGGMIISYIGAKKLIPTILKPYSNKVTPEMLKLITNIMPFIIAGLALKLFGDIMTLLIKFFGGMTSPAGKLVLSVFSRNNNY